MEEVSSNVITKRQLKILLTSRLWWSTSRCCLELCVDTQKGQLIKCDIQQSNSFCLRTVQGSTAHKNQQKKNPSCDWVFNFVRLHSLSISLESIPNGCSQLAVPVKSRTHHRKGRKTDKSPLCNSNSLSKLKSSCHRVLLILSCSENQSETSHKLLTLTSKLQSGSLFNQSFLISIRYVTCCPFTI